MHNPLLHRTEMTVTLQPPTAHPNLSRNDIKSVFAGSESRTLVVRHTERPFGSGDTVSEVAVYADAQSLRDTEAAFILRRDGPVTARGLRPNRQQRKVRKNQRKKVRGTDKPVRL